eukprot:5994799-Ditylum_brightwellii.AAC.1
MTFPLAVLQTTTKYDSCLACILCLKANDNGEKKLEDAKLSYVNSECPKCGFDEIWSTGILKQILLG